MIDHLIFKWMLAKSYVATKFYKKLKLKST